MSSPKHPAHKFEPGERRADNPTIADGRLCRHCGADAAGHPPNPELIDRLRRDFPRAYLGPISVGMEFMERRERDDAISTVAKIEDDGDDFDGPIIWTNSLAGKRESFFRVTMKPAPSHDARAAKKARDEVVRKERQRTVSPGPWRWEDNGDRGDDPPNSLFDGRGEELISGYECKATTADVLVIEAAPEMAALLRFARFSLETPPGHMCKPGCNILACKVDALLARIDGAKEGT